MESDHIPVTVSQALNNYIHVRGSVEINYRTILEVNKDNILIDDFSSQYLKSDLTSIPVDKTLILPNQYRGGIEVDFL